MHGRLLKFPRHFFRRNVLVAQHVVKDKHKILLLKISDFGLARDVYEENFYKKV